VGHELAVSGAGRVEVLAAFGELQLEVGGLLFEVGDLLLQGVDVGGRAEPGFAPGLLAERFGQAFFELADAGGEPQRPFVGGEQVGLQGRPGDAGAGRRPSLPGDVRRRPKHVGVATQHRIFAALRGFLNFQWKRAHRIPFNPVFVVELEAEMRNAPLVWEPDQVVRFLAHAANDRLAFLWRLALLRGFRRGELCGMADCDMDAGAGTITVNAALLELGGKLVWGKPKSRAGERVVALDATTVVLGKAHRARRKREKLAAGEAWQEHGLMFCREDGTPLRPEHVSRRFNALAKDAGLPVIKLHAARHTAASLMLEAGLDVKIVQDTLGHSTSVITRDTYQHVRIQVHKDAAEKVVALLPEETAGAETGL
jgi:integrase